MTEFDFYLSERDTERLFIMKDLEGRRDLTGNEYAQLLIERTLEELFTTIPGKRRQTNETQTDDETGDNRACKQR